MEKFFSMAACVRVAMSCVCLFAGTVARAQEDNPRPTLTVTETNTAYRFLAVAPSGTAFAIKLDDQESRLYASTDNARTWNFRVKHPGGNAFRLMAALSDNTLLAETTRSGMRFLSRSDDDGYTWQEVFSFGAFRTLTPRSIAELDGVVYLLEYQAFTTANTPIRIHSSEDRGRTWAVRYTFLGHRHGHGLAADPINHVLWAFFGDTSAQAGIYRSLDGGLTWTAELLGQPGCIVDAVPLEDGTLLFGQDITFQPSFPHVGRLTLGGLYTEGDPLPGAAYSTFAVQGGGYVIGSAREPTGDIYPPWSVSSYVMGSVDGEDWEILLAYGRLDPNVNVRSDVYYQLPSGELVLQLENVVSFGPGGVGYQLLRFGTK